MGIYEWLRDAFHAIKAIPYRNPPRWASLEASSARMIMTNDADGYAIRNDLYLRSSWLQSTIALVAQTAASVPFSVFMSNELEEEVGIPNHPFEVLLKHPNPGESGYDILISTITNLLLHGNAYWWLNMLEGEYPAEIWSLQPDKVRPIPDGKMYIKGYVYTTDFGEEIELENVSVVHFKRYNPKSRFTGASPVDSIIPAIEIDLYIQEWQRNLFGKDNAKLSGLLTLGGFVNDSDWERLQQSINRDYGGTQRRLAMLRGGADDVKWIPMSLTPEETEYIEGREFIKQEIGSVLAPGMGSMLAINATQASSETGKASFQEFTIHPLLTLIAETLTNQLLPLYGPNLVVRFSDLRITDREMAIKERELFARFHTIDEVRRVYFGTDPIGGRVGSFIAGMPFDQSVDNNQETLHDRAQSNTTSGSAVNMVQREVPSQNMLRGGNTSVNRKK